VFTTTSNSNPDLFEYPVTYFDFDGITVDLAEIKTLTSPYPQNKYWPPVTDIDANGKGYHLILQQDGTADVWIITGLTPTLAYSLQEGWHYDYFSISSEYFYKTITLDPSCSLVFFEDDLWIEGKIQGRGTIVSANLINPVEPTQIVLPDNIEYTTLDGSDGLGVISQTNILISPDSPDVMELKGIFVAQQGRFGRNYYLFNIKDSLEIYGSIVSNDRVGTSWSAGSWIVSGYLKRENYIDPKLVYNPPPFIPSVSSDFKILEWEEVE
jgi:hypothetical protein